MKKYLIITTALTTICFAPEIMAQCTENTDCASLGYTETSCPDGGLKCPLGNYWYCPAEQCTADYKYTCTGTGYAGGSGEACDGKYTSCTCADGYEWKDGICQEEPQAEWRPCSGYVRNCKLGDILYSDGTCSYSTVSGKTPIAVVAYISDDGLCGQAIALKSLGAYQWSTTYKDIPGVVNIGDRDINMPVNDFNSWKNTTAIIDAGNKSQYPAAWAAYEYQTEGTKPGNWYLPAGGILMNIAENSSAINRGLSQINGETFDYTSQFWSSSETNSYFAWAIPFFYTMGGGTPLHREYMYKNERFHVRPVIEF